MYAITFSWTINDKWPPTNEHLYQRPQRALKLDRTGYKMIERTGYVIITPAHRRRNNYTSDVNDD